MRNFRGINCKGITLIELIIVLAILGLVIGIAFSLFGFGNKVFNNGSRQFDVQSAARLASQFIADEIRYAADIEIVSAVPAGYITDYTTIPVYENYLYYDATAGAVIKTNRLGTVSNAIGTGGVLEFVSPSPYKTIQYQLTANSGTRSYTVDNTVFSLNLSLGNFPTVTGVTGGGGAIKYVTLSDYVSGSQAPLVELDGANTSTVVEIHFSRAFTVAGTSVTANRTGKTITLFYPGGNVIRASFSSAVGNNKDFDLQVSFTNLDGSVSVYDYNLVYTNHDNWTIN